MKIENVKLEELKPLERNVRKHSQLQINELIKSLQQFGQTRAMVIDEENNILIGNGMYEALRQMGEKNCSCYRKKGLSETEKKKLILSDNKIYSLGVDDYDEIQNYLKDISDIGDFDIAGFDEYTIKELAGLNDPFIDDEITNYGVVTDEKLIQSVPQTNYEPPKNNEPVKTVEPVTVKVVEQPQINTVDVRKSVICSNCGEVIYID